MTPNEDGFDSINRRTLLKRGGQSALLLGVGTVGFSGTALASDCPRTPGFWANHDWCDIMSGSNSVGENVGVNCPGTSGDVTFGGITKTMPEWQAFLVAPTRGDKAKILGKHFVATTLNFQRRPRDDKACKDKSLSQFNDKSIRDIRQDVKAVLEDLAKTVDWSDPNVKAMKKWNGLEPYKDALDAFNNGTLGLDCDC